MAPSRCFQLSQTYDSESLLAFSYRTRQRDFTQNSLKAEIFDEKIAMTMLNVLPEQSDPLYGISDILGDERKFTFESVKCNQLHQLQRNQERVEIL